MASFATVHVCEECVKEGSDKAWENILRSGLRIRQNFGGVLKEDSTLQECGVVAMEKLIVEEVDDD